jgi:hypothetical protein
MKKEFIFLLIWFLMFFLTKNALAKVLSEEYLKDVKRVKLVNGYLIKLKSQEIPAPNINPENPPQDSENSSPEASINSNFSLVNSSWKKTTCDIKEMIIADLSYEYFSGKEKTFGQNSPINPERNLFVINNELYRPDSVSFEYHDDGKTLRNVDIDELWLIDAKLPDGQQSTRGNMEITYEKNGDLVDLYLNLNNQQCRFEKLVKKLSDIILLEVSSEPENISPLPTPNYNKKTEESNLYQVKVRLKPGLEEKGFEPQDYLTSILEKILGLPSGYLPGDDASRRLVFDIRSLDKDLWTNKFNNDYFLLAENFSLDVNKKYENEYLDIKITEADKNLIPFIKNSLYCAADSDCSIHHNFCEMGAFNMYHLFRDIWGCGSNFDENGCFLETKFKEAKCINNQCTGIGKEEVKNCAGSNP